ncbi:hypothetical protein BGW36DRAFT_401091 [Talaromyces proteolyticus]|uniref:3-hydroxyacyl-CoA dehydrogenase n=1 Tax=Talaromyces proteolyticus TaxID=1131652 RepID=A0AAD4PSA0_9EURO|nr:uncharacterized protein BGW36DRAFT_401091 [Talaromyces proteolyticus]KAH8690712.1 hypothetical protein BGW36DRAFT_401091 [Talaromyces proteolyticus]
MPWKQPIIGNRTVAILGAGVLGRRIACVWAAGGYNVAIRDPSADQRTSAINFIDNNIASFYKTFGNTNIKLGQYNTYEDLASAVKDAWFVIEAVPEKLDLKISTFAELAAKAPKDCIMGSNSSSFKSRLMVGKLNDEEKKRVLNVHYTMPPVRVTEFMTSTFTDPAIFPFLEEKHREVGLLPATARRESTGFIINRLWAAMKRETLMILAEGVTDPKEIDELFVELFGAKTGPCAAMDGVGLDTVALIEENYIKERGLPSYPVDWLRKNYVSQGKIGAKSGKGGLYPAGYTTKKDVVSQYDNLAAPTLYVLDIGVGENVTSNFFSSGKIYAASANGNNVRKLVDNLPFPDGIGISLSQGRMFWSNMGSPAVNDGTIESAKLDGSDRKVIVPAGVAHTPKQLTIDHVNEKIYFADREGMRVHRLNFDGSGHEILVQTGDFNNPVEKSDQARHCVGITVDPKHGKFYWTQKGASKAGQGRIFRANINTLAGATAVTRSDIELLLENLPEPIDLEIDPDTEILYWTDRGEYPVGNSVNRTYVGSGRDSEVSAAPKFDILTRHLHEAIGISLDNVNKHIYFVDMGGSVYRSDLDGHNKTVIFSGKNAFTGLALTHN